MARQHQTPAGPAAPDAQVHFGHGDPAATPPFDWQEGYINTFIEATRAADWSDPDAAKAQVVERMTDYLPTGDLQFLMELSIEPVAAKLGLLSARADEGEQDESQGPQSRQPSEPEAGCDRALQFRRLLQRRLAGRLLVVGADPSVLRLLGGRLRGRGLQSAGRQVRAGCDERPRRRQQMAVGDVISRGYKHDPEFMELLEETGKVDDIDVDRYDALVVAGGQGPMFTSRRRRTCTPSSATSTRRASQPPRSATASRSSATRSCRPASRWSGAGP